MLRKIRQKKVYSFQGTHAKKNQFQVFSILKIIQLIHEDYPNADVQNEGEADFIVEYVPRLNPPMGVAYLKTILLCIVIFFSVPPLQSWHSITMSASVKFLQNFICGDGKRVQWIYGTGSVFILSVLRLESWYFLTMSEERRSHRIRLRCEVEMRKYENDIDTTFIENSSRGGSNIDVG